MSDVLKIVMGGDKQPDFGTRLRTAGMQLQRPAVTTVQVNVGKLCNQACLHCHVEAGPKRTEIIEAKTVDRIIELLHCSPEVRTLDITGGAPELVPDFRRLVRAATQIGLDVIDRCNLTVFFEEGQETLADFLAENAVTVIASLPCYSKENVERQRGTGVFDKSIEGLLLLNKLGYGNASSGLELHLVYNPFGPNLPPAQSVLEASYKERLLEDFGITFNRLFTITNMPIKRYLRQLHTWGKYEEYMTLLLDNFNPSVVSDLMCTQMVSIGWRGELFDCDFNQELDFSLADGRKTLWDVESFAELPQTIAVANHCYGCTAGAGSSCSGALD